MAVERQIASLKPVVIVVYSGELHKVKAVVANHGFTVDESQGDQNHCYLKNDLDTQACVELNKSLKGLGSAYVSKRVETEVESRLHLW